MTMSMKSDPVLGRDTDAVSVLDGSVRRRQTDFLNSAVRRRKSDWPLRGAVDQKPAGIIRVGVVGYGYWGPNVVRNLHSLENCEVAAICDKSQVALKSANRQ